MFSQTLKADTSIFINEILSDGQGTDSGKEYIEFYNTSSTLVEVQNWYLVNISNSGSTKKIILPSLQVKPNEYFVIAEDLNYLKITNGISLGTGKLSMFNDFGKLQLYNSSNLLVSEFSYGDSTEGISWESTGPYCNVEVVSVGISPGVNNSNFIEDCYKQKTLSYPVIIPKIDQINFSLDSIKWVDTLSIFVNQNVYFQYSSNITSKVDIETWSLDSGEVISNPHTFAKDYKGKINLFLKIDDQEYRLSSRIIEVKNNISNQVTITELYPSPESPDKEWIEVFNNDTQEINLSNYFLEEKTTNGTSSYRRTLEDKVLKPKEYYVLYEDSFNLSLNNSGDSIYLLDLYGNLVDTFTYSQVNSSQSVGKKLINNLFSVETYKTTSPTPFNENKFIELTTETPSLYSVEEALKLSGGTKVYLNLEVLNSYGKNLFTRNNQAYYKLKLNGVIEDEFIGQNISATATVKTFSGIKNLEVDIESIQKLSYSNYQATLVELVTNSNLYDLVRIEGVVVEVSSNRYKVKLKDSEVWVYLNSNVQLGEIKKGDQMIIEGTIDFYRDSLRVLETSRSLVKGNQAEALIPASYTQSYYFKEVDAPVDNDRNLIILFGYLCLFFLLVSELIKNRDSVTRFIKKFRIKLPMLKLPS